MKHHLVTTVRLTLTALVLSLGFSSAVSAQEITGTITGAVKDANIGAVSGAIVTKTRFRCISSGVLEFRVTFVEKTPLRISAGVLI